MNRPFSPLQQALITWLLVLLTGWATLNALRYVGELCSILITAGLIAFILNYPVARLQQVRVARGLAVVIVYGLSGLTIAVMGLTILPLVLEQARQLIANAPQLLESGQQQLTELQRLSEVYSLPIDIPLVEQQLLAQLKAPVQAIASGSLGFVVGTFNGALDLILIIVISFYMMLDGTGVWSSFTSILAVDVRDRLTDVLSRNLKNFVTGQLLLGLFMAVTLTGVFWWLKVPFFLLFAVVIGVMEVVPFIGATLGISAVGVIVAFLDWWLALEVIGSAIVVQQIKDNFVAPRILGNLTGASPVIIFSALLFGAKIGGLLGIILAIPLIGVVKSLVEIILDPSLPPQTGSFFRNPMIAPVSVPPPDSNPRPILPPRSPESSSIH